MLKMLTDFSTISITPDHNILLLPGNVYLIYSLKGNKVNRRWNMRVNCANAFLVQFIP